MKFQKLIVAVIGASALGIATLSLTRDSNAQGGAPPGGAAAGPRGGPGFPGQGGPGQAPGAPGQFRPNAGQFMGGGGGGGTAMDSDTNFLYIVQGNMLFKVAKNDLRVLGSTPLMQMPQRGDFPPGAPGGAPGGIPRGGGGGAAGGPPPPPTKSK